MTDRCPVCRERARTSAASLCDPCMRSYMRIDMRMLDVIEWAAARALRFERKRWRALETGRQSGGVP